MQFPNAYSGVKDIYISAILGLVAVGLSIILVFSAAGGLTSLVGILSIVIALIAIVYFVSYIVGIVRASKDEAAFKKALYALLIAIVISLVGNFIKGAFLSGLFSVLSNICIFLMMYMICQGIVNLADRLGDADVSARGKKVMKLELIVWSISIIASLISVIMGGSAVIVNSILTLVSSIISLVAYFMFIGLLGKAKQMLA